MVNRCAEILWLDEDQPIASCVAPVVSEPGRQEDVMSLASGGLAKAEVRRQNAEVQRLLH